MIIEKYKACTIHKKQKNKKCSPIYNVERSSIHIKYIFSRRFIKPAVQWLAISTLTGILFYDNLFISMIMMIFFPLYLKKKGRTEAQEEIGELSKAFNDALRSLSSALEAGYSIENAINSASHDLRLLYPDSKRIIKEFEFMNNQIKNHIPVETVFQEFASRTLAEDIVSLSEILVTAKKTGGDLVKIIKSTSSAISEKFQAAQEIQTTISGKKYEAMVMKSVPYLILLYFRLFSPQYLTVLYDGIQGMILMSILLCLHLLAGYITDKIILIEV